ncbi:MAG: hypothetical protein EPN46_03705 [Candidimonas sp.]|nr:MAG: hypothetical protein EPN77_15025 [Candidimonas sp.]TAM26415.1 MAG: hypothetical protein EPN62_01810 [Candidimonas sp.]TAM79355.1 MAG: hypothetical protein EPN46_03705 [Candidimonas sp.]
MNYTAESLTHSTPKRPDASERMKRAHDAAAYDEWFRGRVQTSRDDPRPSIPNNQVKADFAKRREALHGRMPLNEADALLNHPTLYKPGRIKGTREMVVRPNLLWCTSWN